jgi:hypothetical protein
MNSEPLCTPKQSRPRRQRPPPEPADVTAQKHELESQSNQEHVHTLQGKGGNPIKGPCKPKSSTALEIPDFVQEFHPTFLTSLMPLQDEADLDIQFIRLIISSF